MENKLQNALKSKLYRDSGLVTITSVLAAAINLVVTAVLARSLLKSELGAYGLYFAVLGVASLATLPGLSPIINKAVLINRREFIFRAIRMSLLWSLPAGFLLSLAAVGGYYFKFLDAQTALAVGFVGPSLPILSLDRGEIILMGLNSFRKLAAYKLLNGLLNLIFIGAAAYYFKGLLAVLSALVLFKLASIGIGLLLWSKEFPFGDEGKDEGVEKLFTQARQLTLLGIYQQVSANISRFVLYGIAAPAMATFHVGQNVPIKIKDYFKLFFIVPVNFWLKKGSEHYENQVGKFGPVFLLLSMIGAGLHAFLAPLYVPFVFGEQYGDAVPVAQILSLTIVTKVAGAVLAQGEIVHHDTKFYQKISVIQCTLTMIIGIPLTWKFEAIGLAATTVAISVFGLIGYAYRFRELARKGVVG